jgi:hypothetical protein
MLRGGEGGVLTFSEMGDDTSTAGWFTPSRKSSPQNLDSVQHVRGADFGGSSWFTPNRQMAERPGPGDVLESGDMLESGDAAFRGRGVAARGGGTSFGSHGAWAAGYRDQEFGEPGVPIAAFKDWQRQDQGLDRRDPGEPDGAVAWREIPARGVTAANRWAEVTRGGSPAGLNPNRHPGDDGFPPSGFPPNDDFQESGERAYRGGQGYPADGSCGEQRGGFGKAAPDDVPFRGARPIDVSVSRNSPARRSPAYSAAAASVAPGAAQRRQETAQRRPETGALRRIKESGAMRAIMDTGAMRTLMDTTAMQMLRERYAGKGRVLAIAGVCFWVVLAVGATLLILTHG